MPRLVLAGNNLAAIHTLDVALEALRPPDVLVVAPDPQDRQAWQRSLASHAHARCVPCVTPTDVNAPDVAAAVAAHAPDLLLSVYYTQLFGSALLETVRGRALNFHPSLLPRHRGNAPLIWSIVEGDAQTGLTVHHIDSGIDTGPIVMQRPLPIHEDETGYSLHGKMANLVRASAAELLRDLIDGRELPAGQPQSGSSTYHSSRDPRLNHLDWSDARARIRNVVRALAPPLPGAYSLIGTRPVVLARVETVEPTGTARRAPGMVELPNDHVPIVWAADGPLRLTTVVLNDELVSGSALVNAQLIAEGDVFD
jgi:methionyl-tRNA formyltransferase